MKHYTINQINNMQAFAKEANGFMSHSWHLLSDAPVIDFLEKAESLPIEFSAVDFHEFCEEEAVNYEEFWQFYLAYRIQQCQTLVKQYEEELKKLSMHNKIAGMQARACRPSISW